MNIIGRIFGRGATTVAAAAGNTPGKMIVRKKSPLDVGDFVKKLPAAPTDTELMGIVLRNYSKHEEDAAEQNKGLTPDQQQALAEQRDFFTRRVFFDVRYRCGCSGRCMTGALPCRFPTCFHMRPIVKGGEVFASRLQIESSPLAKQRYASIVEHCRSYQLDVAEKEILDLIAKKRAEALGTGAKGSTSISDKPSPPVATDLKGAAGSPLVEEIVALAIWRAALLVNLQRDAEAVKSLVDLAQFVPQEYAETAIGTAASWACLNDMEVRFYKMHDVDYEPIDPVAPSSVAAPTGGAAAQPAASSSTDTAAAASPPPFAPPVPSASLVSRKSLRPLLLPGVVAACADNTGFLEHVVSNVFGLEVTAIIARAQTSQENNEAIEDPMGTSIVADDVRAFRSLGDAFWERFERLAMMPPMRPPKAGDMVDPSEGDTPKHVLDAVGRSMLLHHIAASYGKLPGSSKEGTNARVAGSPTRTAEEALSPLRDAATGARSTGGSAGAEAAADDQLKQYTAMPLKQRHCVTRMQELLMVVRSHQQQGGAVTPAPNTGRR